MESTMAMAMAMGMGAIIGCTVVLVVVWILSIIACWKLFTKAGEPGWKAIIPIYSTYVLFKLSWKPGMFWVWLVATVVSTILNAVSANMAMAVISVLLYLVTLVISIVFYVKLSKAYEKSGVFAIGLLLLCPIFLLILGLGSSKYVGPQD